MTPKARRAQRSELDAAALPGRIPDLCDGQLDALGRVRDHELDPSQAAPGQLPEESGPVRLAVGGTHIHAEYFAPAVAVGADRHDHGHRADVAVLADLYVRSRRSRDTATRLQWDGRETRRPAR